MKLSLPRLALGFLALGLLVFFYVRTNQIVFADHERFSRHVRTLEQLGATLNEDVLKNRLNLVEDYDQLPEEITALRKSLQALSPIPAFVPRAGCQVLEQRIQELSQLIDAADVLQERFKSQNAVLNNSLRYLPVTGNQLVASATADEAGRQLKGILNNLMRQALGFSLVTSEEQESDIRRSLRELADWRSHHADYAHDGELGSLAAHVNSIVQREPKVEALISKIAAIPIGVRAEDMQHYYDEQFSQAMAAADFSRVLLYAVCALLVVGIGYTVYALHAANTFLEQRVTERTAALSLKNLELEKEITERVRTERLLAEKEHRLRSILESEPECVKVVDAHGALLEMNPAGLRMVEAESASLVVGRPVLNLIAPEYRDAFRELNEAVFRGESRIASFEIVGRKGTRRWVETHACPLRNAEGQIFAQLAVTRDITERRRQEAQLAYERDLLRTLLDHCPDQIYFKDRESRFLTGSQALATRFELASIEDLIGKSDADFFGPEHARAAWEDEQRILRTGESIIGKVEREGWRDDSHKVTWSITTKVPLRDKSNAVIGTFGISKDITALKEGEAKLESVHKQLLETSRRAGMAEVATSVLHNVGNVLNSVNISCSVLATAVRESHVKTVDKIAKLLEEHAADLPRFFASDPHGQKLPGFVARLAARLAREQESLLKEVQHLADHINHIKEIVAMQQSYGKVFGVTERLNVVDLVEDSLRMNAGALIRHQVLSIREYEDVPPVTVEKHKVLQILVNLIRNAKYACDESGRTDKRLTVRVSHASDRVRISVIDNGVGIPAENITRIFSHGFTTRKEGHGFGLHSAVLAAQELGGSLFAQSEGTGKGATFTLEIPHSAVAVEDLLDSAPTGFSVTREPALIS